MRARGLAIRPGRVLTRQVVSALRGVHAPSISDRDTTGQRHTRWPDQAGGGGRMGHRSPLSFRSPSESICPSIGTFINQPGPGQIESRATVPHDFRLHELPPFKEGRVRKRKNWAGDWLIISSSYIFRCLVFEAERIGSGNVQETTSERHIPAGFPSSSTRLQN